MAVGHGATYGQPNGGPFASGPLAWLKWQLKDDSDARDMFVGGYGALRRAGGPANTDEPDNISELSEIDVMNVFNMRQSRRLPAAAVGRIRRNCLTD
jgi:hypothetical protein